ncbi:MAG: hypothetical protein P8Y66_11480 [Nitrospirota bacterium]|jgi:hypothetical protein
MAAEEERMRDDELREWSRDIYRELKTYEYLSCKILDRCCRAALGGGIELLCYEDPVLMIKYRLRLNFCPECGRKLDD